MRPLALGLLVVCSVAAATSPRAVELAHVEDWQIQQVADTVGHDDARRQLIRQRLDGWKLMLESPANLALDDLAKLKLVNDYVNQTPFQCDAAQWCVEDYWATPIEFLANHGGDCEDFAIAKFYALRALGVGADKLRMIYARINREKMTGAHVVLAYYELPDSEPLILDNLGKALTPASARADLAPVFSFNLDGMRVERKSPILVGAETLNPWRDTWYAARNDHAIRFLTPEQRDTPQCKALRTRSAWCK